MKGLLNKMLILTMMLMSAFVFSQSLSQDIKPITYEQKDGVFITIETMDVISLKLIDRQILQKEVNSLNLVTSNLRSQNDELFKTVKLEESKAIDYKNLWQSTEQQNMLLFESLENQKLITKNVKKKPLGTVSYILGEASLSEV